MIDCIFCQIAARKVATEVIYEDEQLLAFDDKYPKASCHKLIIPKQHIATLNDLVDDQLVASMTRVAKILAERYGVKESGYRVLINCNAGGGQEVYHLHMHLIGGVVF